MPDNSMRPTTERKYRVAVELTNRQVIALDACIDIANDEVGDSDKVELARQVSVALWNEIMVTEPLS